MTGKIDFLIIGAEKCGTTWLADMLRQHPDIFIPAVKELFYFNERFFESPELPNYNASQPISWFLQFFAQARVDQIKGEASPAYIWDRAAAERIAAYDSGIKLIAVLRNPIDRAMSQYLYYVQRGVFSGVSFEQALQKRGDILTRGLYAQQLLRYFDLFPAEQIKIMFYDDLRADNGQFLTDAQAFLGVSAMLPDNMNEASNVTGEPRFVLLNRAISWLRYPLRKYNPPLLIKLLRSSGLARVQERVRLANTRPLDVKPTIAPETRSSLVSYFRDDVAALQEMTGRDLRHWLKEG